MKRLLFLFLLLSGQQVLGQSIERVGGCPEDKHDHFGLLQTGERVEGPCAVCYAGSNSCEECKDHDIWESQELQKDEETMYKNGTYLPCGTVKVKHGCELKIQLLGETKIKTISEGYNELGRLKYDVREKVEKNCQNCGNGIVRYHCTCHRDGLVGWSSWSKGSVCSTRCGAGEIVKTRTCHSGLCHGPAAKREGPSDYCASYQVAACCKDETWRLMRGARMPSTNITAKPVCVKLYTINLNFPDAERFCNEREQAFLVSVHSLEQQRFLMDMLISADTSNNKNAWLGTTLMRRWLDNTEFNYEKWFNGNDYFVYNYPVDVMQDFCAFMAGRTYGYDWRAGNCTVTEPENKKMFFFCQRNIMEDKDLWEG